MPTPFKAEGVEIGRARRGLFDGFLQRLSLALAQHAVDSSFRRVIVFYIVFFWIAAWTGWMLAVAIFPGLRLPLVVIGLVLMVTGALLTWLFVGHGATGLWLAVALLGEFILFALAVGALSSVVGDQIGLLWGIGVLLIYLLGLVYLLLPLWHVAIHAGEVFVLLTNETSEGFRLLTRRRPPVDAELLAAVVRFGVPQARLDKFLDLGAPDFMLDELRAAIQPEGASFLELLLKQTKGARIRLLDGQRGSALQQVWLLWDKAQVVQVDLTLNQVITREGSPVNIRLLFAFTFDPLATRAASDFYYSLPKWRSVEALEAVLRRSLENNAAKVAREFFVSVPLISALTIGSINEFRTFLPQRLAELKPIPGVSVRPDSVQCTPIIHESVQEAENSMIAARARAQAETAKLQALLEQVILSGVPPKLLAGLMLLDHKNEPLLNIPTQDIIDLPEATEQQQRRFFLRKYGFAPQVQALNAPPEVQPDDSRPTDAAARRDRRAFNIRESLEATRRSDGKYHVGTDDESPHRD